MKALNLQQSRRHSAAGQRPASHPAVGSSLGINNDESDLLEDILTGIKSVPAKLGSLTAEVTGVGDVYNSAKRLRDPNSDKVVNALKVTSGLGTMATRSTQFVSVAVQAASVASNVIPGLNIATAGVEMIGSGYTLYRELNKKDGAKTAKIIAGAKMVGSALTIAAGGLAIAGLAMTPVGWGLLAGSLAIGVGVLAYKAYKKGKYNKWLEEYTKFVAQRNNLKVVSEDIIKESQILKNIYSNSFSSNRLVSLKAWKGLITMTNKFENYSEEIIKTMKVTMQNGDRYKKYMKELKGLNTVNKYKRFIDNKALKEYNDKMSDHEDGYKKDLKKILKDTLDAIKPFITVMNMDFPLESKKLIKPYLKIDGYKKEF
ncbi:hypothetical protein Slin_4123 [Spirosoma linguale DSM 74]|uniref:Uncharacterized protein n=2 Tax=Spirosoma TaxID=107 RepID=D2QJR4_SPILD|nr:hypothetical protein Slin_4123 [Spirosoma linguale DSM 74]